MVQELTKPDHGWAWVVLVAAFFCNVVFDGIIFSFGLFYLEFLHYFNVGESTTSWISSVISGTYALVGRFIFNFCYSNSIVFLFAVAILLQLLKCIRSVIRLCEFPSREKRAMQYVSFLFNIQTKIV